MERGGWKWEKNFLFDDDVFVSHSGGDHGEDVFGVGDDDVEDVGFFRFEQPSECGFEVFFSLDAFGLDIEAFANLDVVGVNAIEVLGVAEEGVCAVGAIEAVFPLDDHAEVLVVEDDDFCCDAFDFGGGELLDVHEEGAVAINVNDLFIWEGNFCADGGWVTKTHCAEARGGEEGARAGEGEELACPHLVLADAGGDDGVAAGKAVKFFDNELGLDCFGVAVVGEGVILFPLIDLVIPIGVAVEVGRGALEAAAFEEEVKAAEGVADVGEDREADGFILIELGVVDVDVDDGSVLAKFFDFAGDAVIEADADSEEEVGFVNGVVGIDGSVHTEPLEGEGVVFGEASDSHEGSCDGDVGSLDEFEEFCGGVT